MYHAQDFCLCVSGKIECESVTDETIENLQHEVDSGDGQHEADSEVVSTRQTR